MRPLGHSHHDDYLSDLDDVEEEDSIFPANERGHVDWIQPPTAAQAIEEPLLVSGADQHAQAAADSSPRPLPDPMQASLRSRAMSNVPLAAMQEAVRYGTQPAIREAVMLYIAAVRDKRRRSSSSLISDATVGS
jgi:hypothetical protein